MFFTNFLIFSSGIVSTMAVDDQSTTLHRAIVAVS